MSRTPTPRPNPADPGTEASKGNAPGPQLPHERDQSASGEAAQTPPAIGQRAFDDLAQGQADTGRAPVTDAVYERQREGGDRHGAGDAPERGLGQAAEGGEYTGSPRRSDDKRG